jgi:hypothetical protein
VRTRFERARAALEVLERESVRSLAYLSLVFIFS